MPKFDYAYVAQGGEGELRTVGVIVANASKVRFVGVDAGFESLSAGWTDSINKALANGATPLQILRKHAGAGNGYNESISKIKSIVADNVDQAGAKALARSHNIPK